MTSFELLTLIMSFIGVILIPCVVLMIRGAIKWTRTEGKLSELITDVRELVEQGKADKEATDKRLRYIEEWFMTGRRHRAH